VAGAWDRNRDIKQPSLRFTYEIDDGAGGLFVRECALAESFDCPLPDLRGLPGQYCASVVDRKGFPELGPERFVSCGIQLGATSLFIPGNLPESPPRPRPRPTPRPAATAVNLTPPDSEELAIDSRFEWDPRPGSVYVVGLRPPTPFSLAPRIFVVTNQSGFRFRDLVAHGIGFPAGATYEVTVHGIPVASVDEVASLDWWYGRAPEEGGVEPDGRRVTLVDPAARTPDPSAPSNVRDLKDFPAALPVCRSPIRGQVLGSDAFGRTVTVTGFLRCGQISCSASWPGRCTHGCWLSDVAGSSLPIYLFPGHYIPEKWRIPFIPVVATGLLVLRPGPYGLALDEANLCSTIAPSSPPHGAR
jgi:hypothetical protein